MLFLDIDGVVRNLAQEAFGYEPSTWEERVGKKSIVDIINDDLNILLRAEPYYDIVACLKELKHVTFLTAQLPAWIPNTEKWLYMHIPTNFSVIYTPLLCKHHNLLPGDVLIDDYPNFPCYENIILMERPYNKHVAKPCLGRVNTPETFREAVLKYGRKF